MNARRFVPVVLLLASTGPASAAAAPGTSRGIPDELRPWTEWVLHGHEPETCPGMPSADGRRACAWPSRLMLDLDARSGRFEQEWLVRARSFVRLPGDGRAWPQDVRANARPAAVIASEAGGGPGLWLEAGTFRIAGTFAWDAIPESLDVPPQTGLVSLRIAGRDVPSPQRDSEGRLWLQAGAGRVAEAESLTIAIHRRVIDDIPMIVTTRVLLEVSGKAREMILGPALLQGFIPLSLDAPLPARLEPDGRLRLQVRPGSWIVTFDARHVSVVNELSMPAIVGTWAPDEIWCFDARPDLRVVAVEGVPAIDPQQTAIPDDWRSLPTFRVLPGETMTLVEKRRGDAEPAPDQLVLHRSLWLDFDGGGITAQDRLSGTLSRSWRLESSPPWSLGRASVGGEDQLLTRREAGAAPGLEIRQGHVQVVADSRIEGRGRILPAVGWDADVSSLEAMLNLPPGWRLFAAPGADVAGGTWISRWTLLDLFLALIVTIATARLWGWPVGALALATMGLTLTEAGAPRWIWLFVLALEAVRRLLKSERGRHVVEFARLVVVAVLLVVAVVFMLVQARDALHPQLESTNDGSVVAEFDGRNRAYKLGMSDAEAARERAMLASGEIRVPQRSSALLNVAAPELAAAIDRGKQKRSVHDIRTIVQTGPGVPTWRWRTLHLQWNGPVDRGQELRLVLVPPVVNSGVGFLRVILLAALILRAILPRDFDFGRLVPRRGRATAAAPAAAWMIALVLLAALRPNCALAEIPPQEMLDQLRARLLERPPCGDHCAEALRLDLDAAGPTLRLRLEASAVAESALALPGGQEHWNPRSVLLDGRPAEGLLRTADGVLWILLPEGLHQISLEGPLPDRDAVQVPLPARPKRVTARLAGWTLSGLHDGGIPDDTLQLSREASATRARGDELAQIVLPPFVIVTRRIELGLTWDVATSVTRMGPAGAPVLIRVPLLAGESVTTADQRVEEGSAVVTLGPGMSGVAWQSTLSEQPSIALRAPDVTEWTEIWQLDASPSWHVEAAGIPPVHSSVVQHVRVREWRPWPGEQVTVDVTRPEPVAGPSLTIDSSRLEFTPGIRSTDASLSLVVRSSRGGQHDVALPEGAVLQSLVVNGLAQPVRQDGRIVTITVTPGSQQVGMTWRGPTGLVARWRSPDVDLKAPSVNASVQVNLPDRWILWLDGPRLGPAILFWSVLAVFVLLSIALTQWRPAPLGFVSWLLLLVGLSQVDARMGAIVVAWFLLLGWRRRRLPDLRDGAFNVVQILVVAWTIVSIVILFSAIQRGLLGSPEMQVVGNGSHATALNWYADRADGLLPAVSVTSAPLLAYRLAMLAWALWLAAALLKWLRWAWDCFTEGGAWRQIHLRAKAPKAAAVMPPPPPPS